MQDQLGGRIAARLTLGTDELPHDISERLRAARARAIAKRQRLRPQLASASLNSNGEASLGADEAGNDGWRRLASVLPLLALVAGLFAVNAAQNEQRASELAEVDAALLTDALPPSAYSDPGFLQFLKSEH